MISRRECLTGHVCQACSLGGRDAVQVQVVVNDLHRVERGPLLRGELLRELSDLELTGCVLGVGAALQLGIVTAAVVVDEQEHRPGGRGEDGNDDQGEDDRPPVASGLRGR